MLYLVINVTSNVALVIHQLCNNIVIYGGRSWLVKCKTGRPFPLQFNIYLQLAVFIYIESFCFNAELCLSMQINV